MPGGTGGRRYCCWMVGAAAVLSRALRLHGTTRRAARRRRGAAREQPAKNQRSLSSLPQSLCLPQSGVRSVEWRGRHTAELAFAGYKAVEVDTRQLSQRGDKAAWLAARRSLIATASEFSAAAFDAHDFFSRRALLEAKAQGRVLGGQQTEAMAFGLRNEAVALDQYSRATRNEVRPTGLWTDPDCDFGASPDAVVLDAASGEFGVVEVKCLWSRRNKPAMPQWTNCPDRFYAQVQGQLLVTEAAFCDLVAWIPPKPTRRPNFTVVRVHPDPDYQAELLAQLRRFAEDLSDVRRRRLSSPPPAGSSHN